MIEDYTYDYYKYYKLKFKKELYIKNGYSGIMNPGNKCFMTSILHCLISSLSLTDYFLSGDYKEDIQKKSNEILEVGMNYNFLVKKVYDYNQLIQFIPLYKSLCKKYEKYNSSQQQDSHEFLMIFLQLLHNSFCYRIQFKRNLEKEEQNPLIKLSTDTWESFFKNDYSIITKLFYGSTIRRLICNKCDKHDYTFEPFNYIPVYIKENSKNLIDCLGILNDEIVTKSCDNTNCKNKKHTIKTHLWTLPNYLIFVIKRFDNNQHIEKNNQIIDFPINNLDLSSLIHPQKHSEKVTYLYDLYAVNFHTGTMKNGHYFSIIKNVITNEWYTYNDGDIIKHPSFIIENSLKNKNAYILFYHRKFITKN